MTEFDAEVGIIGGGPAGSSMATYLAKAGVDCIVFEREVFPRPHVGESLVPSSTRVFQDLAFLQAMEESGFPHKYGAVWTSTQSNRVYHTDWEGLYADGFADIRFDERNQPSIYQKHTYHVDRGKSDNLLLQHANRLGPGSWRASMSAGPTSMTTGSPCGWPWAGRTLTSGSGWWWMPAAGRRSRASTGSGGSTTPSSTSTRCTRGSGIRPLGLLPGCVVPGLHLHSLPPDHEYVGMADTHHGGHHQPRRGDPEAALQGQPGLLWHELLGDLTADEFRNLF